MSPADRDTRGIVDKRRTGATALGADSDDGGQDRDWAWRRRIRANPATNQIYRGVVAVLGLFIVVGGLALVPLPGPGWLIVFAGLAIWASEFDWARGVLDWVRGKVEAFNDYMGRQPMWFRALAGVTTLLLVLAFFWVLFKFTGVPAWLPDVLESPLHQYARL